MAISLLVAGQSAASISWKPSRDMGEYVFCIAIPSHSNKKSADKQQVQATTICTHRGWSTTFKKSLFGVDLEHVGGVERHAFGEENEMGLFYAWLACRLLSILYATSSEPLCFFFFVSCWKPTLHCGRLYKLHTEGLHTHLSVKHDNTIHLPIAWCLAPPPPQTANGGDWTSDQFFLTTPPGDRGHGQSAPLAREHPLCLHDLVDWIGQGCTRRLQCRLTSVNVPHSRSPVTHLIAKFPNIG